MAAERRVGPYRLIEPLGRGGMGEVWRADDVTGAAGGAPRQVALKLLDPALARDPHARARFAREVASARLVRGPSVAPLLDADVDAPQPWLASAYVAGPNLAEHVARHGPLADAPLRALGAALADALVSIHGAGVVHRDLTPRNVVLGPDGPRVVDFGIALHPGSAAITQTGAWVGTPTWMPPERLTSDRATAASDVWSWGAVMTFAARGTPPLTAAERPEPADLRGATTVDLEGVPAWLVPAVGAALAPDPDRRPTPAALVEAMAAPPLPAAPPVVDPPLPATAADGGGPTQPDPPLPATGPDGGGSTVVQPPLPPTVPYGEVPAGTAAARGGSRRARRRAAAGSGRAGTEGGSPTAHADEGGPPARRRLARWLSAAVVLGGAVAIGLVGGLLVVVIALAVLVMLAVALRLGRERLPDEARPLPPTWSVALAGPVVLGTALVRELGPLWGVAALLALVVVFFLLGGDIG